MKPPVAGHAEGSHEVKINEYAFDVKLLAVVRVRAGSEAEARRLLREYDTFHIGVGLAGHDPVAFTEATIDGDADLFEVNGKDVPSDIVFAVKGPIEWADADGKFLLGDGSFGNPGCDCGMYDAVVRIDGEYLCTSEAARRGLVQPQKGAT